MIVVHWIVIGILGLSILLGLVRVATLRDDASRAVVGDLTFFSAIGILAIVGLQRNSVSSADAVLLASMLGVLATVALARMLTRGQR
ncbi:transporter [Brachybacterium sp. EF45031]|uniref:monovalent cation/H+ antiporter complex subunit F n=1 Tax=Brachybacterium sillae TaxID=2810536 RepID=UPI00217E0EC8|nr:monovalent cation/H+ antiporter complex subunit F [Brachybacterium sillae]MCS6711947.1 transporter [Brachybacterium sillae]